MEWCRQIAAGKDTEMSGIIVGIDGSDNAQPALEWALREAALRAIPLTVIAVNDVMASYWTGSPVISTGDDERLAKVRQGAESAVAAAMEQLKGAGQPSVTVEASNGFAGQTLIEASKDAELLVVGSRGGGGFPHLRIGAVASKVLHHAHCPVVLVPHER